jgi:outer membrane protein assembly factor BamE (lipoprotein component of BamABCDE complex)
MASGRNRNLAGRRALRVRENKLPTGTLNLGAYQDGGGGLAAARAAALQIGFRAAIFSDEAAPSLTPAMATKARTLICLLLYAALAGCGAAYQASTEIRAHRMMDSLRTGQTMPEVRQQFGLPDIITDQDQNTEIWSYASHANSNNLAVALLYPAAKAGDTGQFIDLRFVDGKLVTWSKQDRTMPTKQLFKSFGIGFGAPDWYDTVHPF